jgi:hypothetical protein
MSIAHRYTDLPRLNLDKISIILHKAYTPRYACRRPQQLLKCSAAAPAGPSVTLEHHLARPSPPRAAAGPPDAPNRANLAPARSHLQRGAHMPPARPPRGGHARHRARRVRSTHTSDAAVGGAARASRLRERATADTIRGTARWPSAAGPSGIVGSRWRRCSGAAACASAAHGTRSVVGDQGARPGQHVGSRKVKSS